MPLVLVVTELTVDPVLPSAMKIPSSWDHVMCVHVLSTGTDRVDHVVASLLVDMRFSVPPLSATAANNPSELLHARLRYVLLAVWGTVPAFHVVPSVL